MEQDKETEFSQHEHDAASDETMTEASSINWEEEAQKYKDQWVRAVAEGENTRKRAQKDREDALKYGVGKMAQDILAIADNMKRALENCPMEITPDWEGFVNGIRLIDEEIKRIFDRHHIKEIYPLGELFDPHVHQAMFDMPATEVYGPGQVAQVLQTGYILHDRLLRPALVGVVKKN